MIEPTIHPTKPKSKTIDLVVSPYKRKSSLYKKDIWTVTDSYIPYKKEFGVDALERKLYIKIMKEIFWEISKDLIQSILEITLLFRLGRLGIKKRKNNRTLTQQPIDYGKYNKTKTKVYHTIRNGIAAPMTPAGPSGRGIGLRAGQTPDTSGYPPGR